MEEYKQIGLHIWGIRGGFESFCHTDNIDIKTPEIANTWDNIDIREIVNVSNLSVRFYALEFTPNYKVFTIYRPEKDAYGRPGACMATTLYVPHALKINNILDLLKQISDTYHKDHYDAFGNPNNAPDYIQVYLEIVKNFAGNIVREEVVRPWESSAQDRMPCLLPFSSLDVVAKFFATPYRLEFMQHQEVMFWDSNHIANPQVFGVKFLKQELLTSAFKTDGEGIKPQFDGGQIQNTPPAGIDLFSFKREGLDITSNWRSAFFYDDTSVEIEFRKPFYMPFKYNGPMKGSGACPFLKQGEDYRFSSSISLLPCQYEMQVRTPDVPNIPFDLLIGSQTVAIISGMGKFRFEGRQADETFKVSLKQGDSQIKVGEVRPSQLFKNGSDAPDPTMTYTVEGLKSFHFHFNKECSGKLRFSSGEQPISFVTRMNNVFDIVLPAALKTDFAIAVDGYEAKLQSAGGNLFEVMLTRNSFDVEFIIPDNLTKWLKDLKEGFWLRVAGKDYDSEFSDGKFRIKGLPMELKNSMSDSVLHIRLNKELFMMCEKKVGMRGENITIEPQLVLLHNDTGSHLMMKVKADSQSLSIPPQSYLVVSAPFSIKYLKDADQYNESRINKSGYDLVTVTSKTPVGAGGSGGSQGSGIGSSTNRVLVGRYMMDGYKITIPLYEGDCRKKGEYTYEYTIEKRPCIFCFRNKLPDPNKQRQYDAKNKANGFVVKVDKDKQCYVVKNKKHGIFGNMKRWKLFGGIGLGALLIAGFFILAGVLGWFNKNNTLNIIGSNYSRITVKIIKSDPENMAEMKNDHTLIIKPECDYVNVKIECENEGTRDININIDSSWFGRKKHNKDTIINTAAWEAVDILNKLSSTTIEAWKNLESLYNNASAIKDTCVNSAFNIVQNNNSYKNISDFKSCFPGEKNKEIYNMCQSGEYLYVTKFKEALEKVWSLDCSRAWVDSLDKYNDSLNKISPNTYGPNMEEKNNLMASIIKKDNPNSTNIKESQLIDLQKQFFTCLSSTNKTNISSFKRFVNDCQSQQYFSDDQKNVHKEILNSNQYTSLSAGTPIYPDIKDTTSYRGICNSLNLKNITTENK